MAGGSVDCMKGSICMSQTIRLNCSRDQLIAVLSGCTDGKWTLKEAIEAYADTRKEAPVCASATAGQSAT